MRRLKFKARQGLVMACIGLGASMSGVGCKGVIQDNNAQQQDPTDPGTGGGDDPVDPGPINPGDDPDDPGGPGSDPDDPAPPEAWVPRPLSAAAPDTPNARLRIVEYKNTVAEAFGLERAALNDLQLASDGSDNNIFTTNAVERVGDFRVYVDAAQTVSELVAAQLVSACTWTTTTNDCIQNELRPRIERLFRSTVSNADVAQWASVFSEIRGNEASEEIALGAILYLVLLDERFLFHRESGQSPDAVSTTLTNRELASRLAYFMTESPPDAQLSALAASGELQAQLPAQIRRLFDSDAVDETIWRFVTGWLSLPWDRPAPPAAPAAVDECDFTSECKAIHGDQATDCVNSQSEMSWCACGAGVRCAPPPGPAPLSLEASAWEETRRFVLHVLKSDTIPLSELFTANYSFINGTLAEHYGVPAPAQDWQRYEFPEGANRVGLLSQASFLMGNGSHERDVSWIFRGKALYERMFCGQLGLPMEGAIGEEVTDRVEHEFCGTCHQFMDPSGKLFDAYDDTGKFIGTEFTALPINAGSDIDGNYNSLAEFVAKLPDSEALNHCFVRMWFRFVMGRQATKTDEQSFDAALAALTEGKTAKAVMTKLLETEAFRSLHRAPDRRVCQ